MTILKYTSILLVLICISCSRDDFDDTDTIFNPLPEPEVIIQTPNERTFGVQFQASSISDEPTNVFGFGEVERIADQELEFFGEVIVTASNPDNERPFLLGWFMDDASPGTYEGALTFLVFRNADSTVDFIESGISNNTSFIVNLTSLGPRGTLMEGDFSGTGIRESTGEEEEFSGTFTVPRGFCSDFVVRSADEFNDQPEEVIGIEDARIIDDCLFMTTDEITGCSFQDIPLVDANEIIGSNPPQRNIRIKDNNTSACPDEAKDGLSYDITSLRVDGTNEVVLNLQGWDEPLTYRY